MAEDAQGPAFCGDEQMAQALSAVVRAASHRAEGFQDLEDIKPREANDNLSLQGSELFRCSLLPRI